MRAVFTVLTLLASGGAMMCSFSRRELECLSSRKVLVSGRCHQLLEQGPCKAGSRVTLDEASLPGISAVCSPCKCCDVPRGVWWPGDNTCRRTRDEDELCGGPSTGTYLGEDFFGDGACLCRPGYTTDQNSGACYALYHRGPCPQGQVFVVAKSGDPQCVHDPCAHENSTSAMAPDGRCYPLGSRGPCPDDSSFNVHPETMRPQCIDRTNHIIQLPCLSQVSDVAGGCKDEVQPENDTSFGLALIQAARKKRKSGKHA